MTQRESPVRNSCWSMVTSEVQEDAPADSPVPGLVPCTARPARCGRTARTGGFGRGNTASADREKAIYEERALECNSG